MDVHGLEMNTVRAIDHKSILNNNWKGTFEDYGKRGGSLISKEMIVYLCTVDDPALTDPPCHSIRYLRLTRVAIHTNHNWISDLQ